MSTSFHNKPIVNDGLVFVVDAKNSKSVPTSDGTRSAKFISSNVEFLDSPSADFDKPTGDFSIGCWVYLPSFNPDGAFICKWGANQRSYALVNTSGLGFFVSTNGSGNATSVTRTSLSINTWYFIVSVRDDTNNLIKISVDGDTFTTSAFDGVLHNSSENLSLGAYGDGVQPNDTLIDNAFFYNKALTQQQVTDLYNSGNGTNYNNADKIDLVSWWSLNETKNDRHDSHGTNHLTDNGSVGFDTGKVTDNDWNLNQATYDLIDDTLVGDGTNGMNVRDGVWEFDGVNDVVDYPNTFQYSNLSQMSVFSWAKFDILDGRLHSIIHSVSVGINNSFRWSISGGVVGLGGVDGFFFLMGNGSNEHCETLPGLVTIGEWFNIGFVFDGTETGDANRMKIFFNGNQLGGINYKNGAVPATTYSQENIIQMGTYQGAGYSLGETSSIQIYDRALTPVEVKQNYDAIKSRFRL